MPLISIGIPAYNATNFLEIAVQSVKDQSLTDWELVIVNDGSKDHTGDLAEKLAVGDNRIRVVHQENRGLAAARNAAMAAMQDSEYAIFLDHDDVWKPELLGALATTLQRTPSAVGAYCIARNIDADGNFLYPGWLENYLRHRRRVQGNSSVAVPLEDSTCFKCLAIECWLPSPGSALLRRKVMAQAGAWDPRPSGCEDYEMWLRLSLFGDFVLLNDILFYYRRHDSNMSATLSRMRKGELITRKIIMAHPAVTEEQRQILRIGYRVNQRIKAANKIRHTPELLARGKFKDATQDVGRAASAMWRSIAGLGV